MWFLVLVTDMTIPSEILIPAIVSVVLAIIAHFVSILMQGKSNKHDFKIRSFDTMENELAETRRILEAERRENRLLRESNTDLRGIKYRLEVDLNREKELRDDMEGRLSQASSELNEIKELLFQATAEIELLKKKNQELIDRIEKDS